MKRLWRALQRWWYGDGRGQHERPRGDEFDTSPDITKLTIPRRPTLCRPPWETAPLPCLIRTPLPDPTMLHPIVQAQLGATSVAEYIERLFPNIPLAA